MAIVPFTDETYTGLVGQHANSEEWNAITRLATDVDDNPIGFGQPVYRVAANDKYVSTAANGAALGVTRYRVDIDNVTGYEEYGHVSVMTMGIMYVAAGGDCTAGAPAFYDAATDRWSDATGVAIAGAEFDTSAAAGGIVKIRINRPAAVAPAAP